MKRILLAVVGRDKPGIIAAVSGILLRLDCNIENVSQTILQTEFSGTFIVSLPEGLSPVQIKGHLSQGLASMGLEVFAREIGAAEEDTLPQKVEPFVITTRGPDRKGLVAGITEVIARHGVNVTHLQAVFKGGKNPIDNIMIYEVDVSPETDLTSLRAELGERAEALGLRLSIQHRNIFEAINRV